MIFINLFIQLYQSLYIYKLNKTCEEKDRTKNNFVSEQNMNLVPKVTFSEHIKTLSAIKKQLSSSLEILI